MGKEYYKEKVGVNYFANSRKDIEVLLPRFSRVALEVGCGEGSTLRWLKESNLCSETHGIDIFEPIQQVANSNVDVMNIGDVSEVISKYPDEYFDLVLCLDVLEHLTDPWTVVLELQRTLKPGGVFVASIPNIRNFNSLYKIIIKRSFEYEINGIFDKTHLRFYAKNDAINLLNTGELKVDKVEFNPRNFTDKRGWLNAFSFGLFRELLTSQFLIRAIKNKSH
jgi:2-polyprenyl-3-methyl-5-hydroxy-6-metoxy-1,4-benzoquinol methylase